jgi:hypothetical protein
MPAMQDLRPCRIADHWDCFGFSQVSEMSKIEWVIQAEQSEMNGMERAK